MQNTSREKQVTLFKLWLQDYMLVRGNTLTSFFSWPRNNISQKKFHHGCLTELKISGRFKDSGPRGQKHLRGPCLKIFIYQNYSWSNLSSVFLKLMSFAGKGMYFTSWITERSVCFMLEIFWFLRKNHVKIKKTGCIHIFSCNIIESKNQKIFFSIFIFFFLGVRPLPATKSRGSWAAAPRLPLKSPLFKIHLC